MSQVQFRSIREEALVSLGGLLHAHVPMQTCKHNMRHKPICGTSVLFRLLGKETCTFQSVRVNPPVEN
jgi:hypothetical protein